MKCRKVKVSICLLARPVALSQSLFNHPPAFAFLRPSRVARRPRPSLSLPHCPLAGDDQLGRVLTALFVKTVPLVQGEVTKGTQGDT